MSDDDDVLDAYQRFNEATRGIDAAQRARIFEALVEAVTLARRDAFGKAFIMGAVLTLAAVGVAAWLR